MGFTPKSFVFMTCPFVEKALFQVGSVLGTVVSFRRGSSDFILIHFNRRIDALGSWLWRRAIDPPECPKNQSFVGLRSLPSRFDRDWGGRRFLGDYLWMHRGERALSFDIFASSSFGLPCQSRDHNCRFLLFRHHSRTPSDFNG